MKNILKNDLDGRPVDIPQDGGSWVGAFLHGQHTLPCRRRRGSESRRCTNWNPKLKALRLGGMLELIRSAHQQDRRRGRSSNSTPA